MSDDIIQTTQSGHINNYFGSQRARESRWRELCEVDSPELADLRQLECEGWKEAERRECFHWGILTFLIVPLACLWLLSALPFSPQLFAMVVGGGMAVVFGSNIARLQHEARARALMQHHAARINAIDAVLRQRVD